MRKLLTAVALLVPLAVYANDSDPWPSVSGGLTYTQAIFDNTLFYSDQDIVDGDFLVDVANYATLSGGVDADNDLTPEFVCVLGTCFINPNEDGINDFTLTALVLSSDSTAALFAKGFGAGNGTSGASSAAACIFRDSTSNSGNTVDKLFEDKNCNALSGAPAVPEAGEPFVTDMQRRLSADVSTDGAGGANDTTGIQATGLKLDLDWIGAYLIQYQILSQSSATGTGLDYGVEYTGTETSLYCIRTFTSTGTGVLGTTGVIDDVANTNAGQMTESYAANAASTTAPNMGPNAGVATANSTALETIECNLLTTTAGDLTFHFASETDGTAVTIKANSLVRATPFP